jgi:hypothetical protein
MPLAINIDAIYKPSEDVVVRQIHGEMILVPIASGMGDLEDALFTLNDSAKAVWERLDGKTSLKQVARDLHVQFDAGLKDIEQDVIGIVRELCKRKMLVRSP